MEKDGFLAVFFCFVADMGAAFLFFNAYHP
jgi:hypothetical protein